MFPHSNFRYRYVKVNCEMHGSKHLPMQYNRREEKTAVIVWIVSLPDQDSWTLLSIIVQNNSIDSLSVTLIRDNGKPVIRHDPHKLLKRATDINDTQSIKCMNLRAIYIYIPGETMNNAIKFHHAMLSSNLSYMAHHHIPPTHVTSLSYWLHIMLYTCLEYTYFIPCTIIIIT